MDLRLVSAILLGKIIGSLTKFMGGGATAAPGLYALKIDAKIIEKLTKNQHINSIVVSGTNGKTTTSRLISDVLSTKFKIIHNRQGSNLLRGIASTLISQTSLFGKTHQNLAIWEVDEAILPETLLHVKPKILVLLNLFRDQLDRYGEVDSLRDKWQKSLELLPKSAILIANADDPQICYITQNFKGKVIFFGVNETKLDLPEISHVADIRYCLNCGSKLHYSLILSSHLGHYSCPNCGFMRPNPDVFATDLKFKPNFSTSANFSINNQHSTFNYQLPGLYNAYNILAALSVSLQFKINSKVIRSAIFNFSAAFGRAEEITIQGKKARIFLIKNPTGANEVIRVLAQHHKLNLFIALNDNFADGRDVSWIWDTNWDVLSNKINLVTVSGTRAWDMTTRLKYAGFKLSKKLIDTNINYSLNRLVKSISENELFVILPTYTALLEIKKGISKSERNSEWHKQ